MNECLPNKPLKILVLLEHLKVGGAERTVVDLADAIDFKCIQYIFCLYRERGIFSEQMDKKGIPVYFLKKDTLSSSLPHWAAFMRLIFIPIESFIFVIRLALYMRKMKIQIVHAHMFSANLWGRIAALLAGGIPIITTEHNVIGQLSLRKRKIINQWMVPLSTKIVAVSEAVAQSVSEFIRIPKGKLVVIPNGIQIHVKSKLHHPLVGTRPYIATIGRFVSQKRQLDLIRAMKICVERIPSISCFLIGDGPEKENIKNLIHELDLEEHVKLLGERKDVRDLLYELDLIVNTSDREGLPISLLEAMASGLPIVATNAGGNCELINSGQTGLLVDVGDHSAIADAICTILENNEVKEKYRTEGIKLIEKEYAIDQAALKWTKLYQDLMK